MDEVKDVDLAPDLDENRVLTEEDLKETTEEDVKETTEEVEEKEC